MDKALLPWRFSSLNTHLLHSHVKRVLGLISLLARSEIIKWWLSPKIGVGYLTNVLLNCLSTCPKKWFWPSVVFIYLFIYTLNEPKSRWCWWECGKSVTQHSELTRNVFPMKTYSCAQKYWNKNKQTNKQTIKINILMTVSFKFFFFFKNIILYNLELGDNLMKQSYYAINNI